MIEHRRNSNVDQVHNRRLAITAAATFLVAVGVFDGLSRLPHQVAAESQTVEKPAYRQLPDLEPPAQEETVARARVIREKFRPWAQQHQAALIRMLRAKPDDQAAMVAVWEVLPPNGAPPWLKGQDLLPTGDPDSPSSFTWAPAVKGIDASILRGVKSEEREMVLMGVRKSAEQREDDFAGHRDLVISASMGRGRTHVQVWASGCITERTLLPAKDRPAMIRKWKKMNRPVRESDLWGPYREIETPFDFLTSKR